MLVLNRPFYRVILLLVDHWQGIVICTLESASCAFVIHNTGDTGKRAPRICILGGGFGGLYTAIKLETLMWPQGKKPTVSYLVPYLSPPQCCGGQLKVEVVLGQDIKSINDHK